MGRDSVQRYGVAILAWLVGWGMLHVARLFTPTPFVLFYGSVMVAAWYGGWGPGLLATGLSSLVLVWQVMPLIGTPGLSPGATAIRTAVFVLQGALTSLLCEHLRRARVEAHAAQRVAEDARREASSADARTRAGQAVQDELRTRLAAIVESSDDAILSLSPDGHVLSWNHGAERLYGWRAEDVLGRNAEFLVPEPERAQVAVMLERVRAGETVGPLEGVRLRQDGGTVQVSVVLSPLREAGGEVIGAASIARDIGERHRAEEAIRSANASLDRRVHERTAALEDANRSLEEANRQLEAANRELDAFSFSVSHDLRAPLRAIDGFSRILLDDLGPTLDDDARRHLNLVRENAQRMGVLIQDLLSFSRLSRQALERQRVDVRSLVQAALTDLRPEMEGRTVEIDVGELPACDADAALLKQVFVNLLSNALKYTRKRDRARIEVGGTTGAGENTYFVRDNGVGFDMKYAGKLFGVFQRLHRADEYEGTGVGLAIAQRIVFRHGGRIWAEAAPDQGATFWFTLPAVARSGAEGGSEMVAAGPPPR